MARLVVDHEDFRLVFHCGKLAKVLERARSNSLDGKALWSRYACSGTKGPKSVKIEQDTGTEEIASAFILNGNDEANEQAAPFFFDNTDYSVDIDMLDRCRNPVPESRHADPECEFNPRPDQFHGHLQFRNDIGRSRFGFSYAAPDGVRRTFRLSFHVLSSKLDYHSDWEKVFDEVEEEYRMLSFDFLRRTYHAFKEDPDGETSDRFWWEVFEKKRKEFLSACHLILNRPRKRYRTIEEFRRADQLRILTPALENEFAENWRNPSHLYLDARGDQTKDTPENRFFKYAVRTVSERFDQLSERIREEAARILPEDAPDGARARKNKFEELSKESAAVSKELRSVLANPFFRGIGPFEGLRQVSLILQRAPGYATVMRTFMLLNALFDLEDGLYGLESKNIADLYELWCFIEVKNRVAAALGADRKAIRIANAKNPDDWFGMDPKKGAGSLVPVNSPDGQTRVEVLYNAESVFDGSSGIRGTVARTVNQKPDIILRIDREGGVGGDPFRLTYLFDAKYRLADEDDTAGVGAPPDDAINQMHRFRDSIYYSERAKGADPDDGLLKKEIIGGYVLFPGRGTKEQIRGTRLWKSIRTVNIGAMPLRPGFAPGSELLTEFIRNLVDKKTSDHLLGTPSQALKGTKLWPEGDLSTMGIVFVPSFDEKLRPHGYKSGFPKAVEETKVCPVPTSLIKTPPELVRFVVFPSVHGVETFAVLPDGAPASPVKKEDLPVLHPAFCAAKENNAAKKHKGDPDPFPSPEYWVFGVEKKREETGDVPTA